MASALDGVRLEKASSFIAFGSMADFTVQTLVNGGSGIVSGSANVTPRSKIVVRVWDLWTEGSIEEAMKLQVVSRSDWLLRRPGVYGSVAVVLWLWRICNGTVAEVGKGGSRCDNRDDEGGV